jgi:hypothetical protein
MSGQAGNAATLGYGSGAASDAATRFKGGGELPRQDSNEYTYDPPRRQNGVRRLRGEVALQPSHYRPRPSENPMIRRQDEVRRLRGEVASQPSHY